MKRFVWLKSVERKLCCARLRYCNCKSDSVPCTAVIRCDVNRFVPDIKPHSNVENHPISVMIHRETEQRPELSAEQIPQSYASSGRWWRLLAWNVRAVLSRGFPRSTIGCLVTFRVWVLLALPASILLSWVSHVNWLANSNDHHNLKQKALQSTSQDQALQPAVSVLNMMAS